MSGRVKWSELTDKDKVKLIIEGIMSHDVGDHIIIDDHHEVACRDRGIGARFVNWPAAAWDETAECWKIRDHSNKPSTFFDPLHDMGDAWLVYFHAVSKYYHLSDSLKLEESQPFRRFAEVMLGSDIYIYDDKLFPDKSLFKIVAQWDETKICKAALAAYGVEIE
jgi:hypothetical protein